jgi:hypothetical protein
MSEDLTKKLPRSDSEKLNAILTTVGAMDTRLTVLEQNVTGLEHKLVGLEQKVEARLHDTRPIWHKLVADIAQLQTGQDAMLEQIGKLSVTVRDVSRDQIVFNEAICRIQLDFHRIDERLERLELNRHQRNSST